MYRTQQVLSHSDPCGQQACSSDQRLSCPASVLRARWMMGETEGFVDCCPCTCWLLKPCPGAMVGSGSVTGPEEEAAAVSAAWRKWRINRGLCERLKLIGSTTVHLHRLPRKQQADVTMQVDLPRLGTLEPGRDWIKRMRRVNNTGKQQVLTQRRKYVSQFTSDERGSARCVHGRGASC